MIEELRRNPNSPSAQGNLGSLLKENPSLVQIPPQKLSSTESAAIRNSWGLVLKKQQKLPEAIEQFRQAIALNPQDADAYYNLANALSDLNDIPGAVKEYKAAIGLRPNYAAAYNNMGHAFHRDKKLSEAIEQFRQAIAFNPQDADAHYNLANALFDQEGLEDAVKAYQMAIKIAPDYTAARNNIDYALKALQSSSPSPTVK